MKKNLSERTKLILGLMVLVIVISTAAIAGAIQENNQRHIATIQVEKNKLHYAEKEVTGAYSSRQARDIEGASQAIQQLDSKTQKSEVSSLKLKLSKLNTMLSKLNQAKEALAKFKSSHKDEDLKSSQGLINKLTEKYLLKDKEKLQAELAALKKEASSQQSSMNASSAASDQSQASSSSGTAPTDTAEANTPVSSPSAAATATTPSELAKVSITAGYTQTCSIRAGQTLLSVITEQMGAQATSAGFVTAVGSLQQDPSQKKYIMFKVNGVQVSVGAASVLLHDGDQVEFYLITM